MISLVRKVTKSLIKYKIYININKDEKAIRFVLSTIRGELLEREKERERKRVLGYYTRVTYYP